jgi:acetyl esterase/lipase
MRDGSESEALVFKYHSSVKDVSRPLEVLSFGGAFCFGSRYQLAPQSRAIVKATVAVVVSISYRLAPEHKLSSGPIDVWDSVK